MNAARRTRVASIVRWASVAAIVVGLVLLARSLPLDRALRGIDRLVRGAGAWGPLVYGSAYVAGALLLLPGSVLTLGAGALFGPLRGLVVVSLAATTTAALAFLLGRYAARGAVERLARRRRTFGAIDRAVGEGGWKVVALLRLSPLVPFSVGNYLFGLTPVRFVPYVLASWAAMLPGTFLYVYLGHAGREGLAAAAGADADRTPGEWALLGAGLVATVIVTVLITRRARAALKKQAEEPTTAAESERKEQPARPWRLGALAGVGAVTLTAGLLAACGVLDGLLGPPEVDLREAYKGEQGSSTFDHSLFDQVLEAHVDEAGYVDYRALKADPTALERYLDQLAAAEVEALGRDERLALLINAYNAFTLKLILDHYPVESIMDIPADQRWDGRTWTVGGRSYTLNELEHEQLRPKFIEPRIHFAVNCASIGCPPLRREAYVGARIDAQLENQARDVHARPRWFRYEPERGLVHLTRVYDWYRGDFEQVAGSALDFAARYSAPLRKDIEAGRRPEVRWLEYDWSLNARAAPVTSR